MFPNPGLVSVWSSPVGGNFGFQVALQVFKKDVIQTF